MDGGGENQGGNEEGSQHGVINSMADTLTLAVRLKFDGKEVVGGIDVSRDQLRKLAADAQRAAFVGVFAIAQSGGQSLASIADVYGHIARRTIRSISQLECVS